MTVVRNLLPMHNTPVPRLGALFVQRCLSGTAEVTCDVGSVSQDHKNYTGVRPDHLFSVSTSCPPEPTLIDSLLQTSSASCV